MFEPYWRESEKYIQNCYMDNRLGVWNSLKVAENLTNGIIVFHVGKKQVVDLLDI